MRKFQDEVRSALLLYAIVPVVLITVICLLLAALYWQRECRPPTRRRRYGATGAIFTELTQDYEERAAAIAAGGLDGFHAGGNGRSAAMERIYAQLNRYGAQPHFFLLDAERHILFSNRAGSSALSSAPVNALGRALAHGATGRGA